MRFEAEASGHERNEGLSAGVRGDQLQRAGFRRRNLTSDAECTTEHEPADNESDHQIWDSRFEGSDEDTGYQHPEVCLDIGR